MRRISFLLLGLLTYLIQAQLFPVIFVRGWQPDLFFVWVVLIAFIKGKKKGLIVAFMAGIVQDIILGNFFGLHLVPYVIVAYLSAKYGQKEDIYQWYRAVGLVVIMTVVDAVIRMILLALVFTDINVLSYIFYFVFPILFMNGVLGIAVYKLIWMLAEPEEVFW